MGTLGWEQDGDTGLRTRWSRCHPWSHSLLCPGRGSGRAVPGSRSCWQEAPREKPWSSRERRNSSQTPGSRSSRVSVARAGASLERVPEGPSHWELQRRIGTGVFQRVHPTGNSEGGLEQVFSHPVRDPGNADLGSGIPGILTWCCSQGSGISWVFPLDPTSPRWPRGPGGDGDGGTGDGRGMSPKSPVSPPSHVPNVPIVPGVPGVPKAPIVPSAPSVPIVPKAPTVPCPVSIVPSVPCLVPRVPWPTPKVPSVASRVP